MFRLTFCITLFALIGFSVYHLNSPWPLLAIVITIIVKPQINNYYHTNEIIYRGKEGSE